MTVDIDLTIEICVKPGGSYLFCFWTLGNTNKNLHKTHASNKQRGILYFFVYSCGFVAWRALQVKDF